jgi:hypothetical protein
MSPSILPPSSNYSKMSLDVIPTEAELKHIVTNSTKATVESLIRVRERERERERERDNGTVSDRA